MLFAVMFGDQEAFDRISGWTASTLRRDHDSLHAWRYVPSAAGNKVEDTNNATDGDLLIALALARAARRWHRPDCAQAAASITRDIVRLLVRDVAGRTVLLPGANGFVTEQTVVVNPSYYIFPALAELARWAEPYPLWAKVTSDGLSLITTARFGRWQLPPDWLAISRLDGAMTPAPAWPARFSYDAIRVPLYLVWGRIMPQIIEDAFLAYWSGPLENIPAWVDLTTDLPAPYQASPGIQAVAQLIRSARAESVAQPLPPISAAPDYYSAILILLARIAATAIRGGALP
jgi:endoglucanase